MRECGMDRRVIIASCEAEAGRNRDDLALRSALEKLGAGVETLAWNAPGFEESSAELMLSGLSFEDPDDVRCRHLLLLRALNECHAQIGRVRPETLPGVLTEFGHVQLSS